LPTVAGDEQHPAGSAPGRRRVYHPNSKHKHGARGDGPPRWFPDSASKCPPSIDLRLAQELLEEAISGEDPAHPSGHALYAIHDGQFFKAYPTEIHEDAEVWHGYPVKSDQVRRQIPARVLRDFVSKGLLGRADYKRFLGNAR
jgi:hypothetical protein